MQFDVQRLKSRIDYMSTSGAPISHWYSSHECSILATNAYGRPVVILSAKRSEQIVYPPLTVPFSTKVVPIFLHYSTSHFDAAIPKQLVMLKYPRVDPQSAGLQSIHPTVRSWVTFFNDNAAFPSSYNMQYNTFHNYHCKTTSNFGPGLEIAKSWTGNSHSLKLIHFALDHQLSLNIFGLVTTISQ